MQQFRPFVKTDEIQEVEASDEPFVPATDALAPMSARSTAQLLVPDEEQRSTSVTTGALSRVKIDPSVLNALQPAENSGRRLTIIRAEMKRKQVASSPDRHLSPRLRQTVMLLTTLLVLGVTLITVVPLATGQSPFNLPAGLGSLLHSIQADLQNLTQQGSSQASATGKGLPPMQIPRSQLVAIAQQDAINAGIDPTYFVRQINLESGFNPNAVSPGGAEGIAQFEPSTAAGLGINPFDPIQALQAAAQMMARYYHQYGDYAKALAAYNAGPASLQNAVNSCGANWLSCMPAQTQNYVHTIMG
jgi:hypothetical protein